MDKLHSSELGTFLRKERTKRNISIVDLSNGLVSASMLQKIETGERPIEKRICQRMLERLGNKTVTTNLDKSVSMYTEV